MLALYAPPGFKIGFSKLFLGNVAPQIEGYIFPKPNEAEYLQFC